MADAIAAAPATPAAAPAATTPANTNTETKAAPKSPAPKSPAPVKTEAPAWSDQDDAELFEKLKRSPYKAKIKGEERALDGKESLRDILNHAQRGIGASKMVEEKNRLEAQAKEHQAKLEKYERTLEAARRGDFAARQELGLIDPREVKAREAEWDAVPPEVKELYDDRTAQQKRADAAEAKLQAIEAEQQQKREAAEMQRAKHVALNETHKALEVLGLDKSSASRMLPFVAGAIADLQQEGLELGVDMTTELIVDAVKARAGAFDERHFESLAPKKAVAVMAARFAKMPDAELLETLPPDFVTRVAKLKARAMTQQRSQPQAPVVRTEAANENIENPSKPKLLQPWHFRR